MHSCDYRKADVFEGKRVLVVGCGNSACDIAVDGVHRAASVDMSVRRGYCYCQVYCGQGHRQHWRKNPVATSSNRKSTQP